MRLAVCKEGEGGLAVFIKALLIGGCLKHARLGFEIFAERNPITYAAEVQSLWQGELRGVESEGGILHCPSGVVEKIFWIRAIMQWMFGGGFQKPRVACGPHTPGELARNGTAGTVHNFVGHHNDRRGGVSMWLEQRVGDCGDAWVIAVLRFTRAKTCGRRRHPGQHGVVSM